MISTDTRKARYINQHGQIKNELMHFDLTKKKQTCLIATDGCGWCERLGI